MTRVFFLQHGREIQTSRFPPSQGKFQSAKLDNVFLIDQLTSNRRSAHDFQKTLVGTYS